MPRFPTTEAEIILLCQEMIGGLPSSPFTGASFTDGDLKTQLEKFTLKRTEATGSEAAWRQDVGEKNGELDILLDMMKTVLRHAENIAKGDAAQLQQIGWGARSAATALQPPAQPRTLEAPTQGDGFVFLDWKEPIGGGEVAVYKILRRERPAGNFQEVASAFPSEYTLINQPKGVELEYTVVASNRAGDSTPSNTVAVVL